MHAIQFTDQFQHDYKKLTHIEQKAIKRALIRMGSDLHYPSLRVKKMRGREEIWEASASRDLRLTFLFRDPDTLILRTCGHHDDALGR